MLLTSADTERLRLERWDHAVHGGLFALVNAQPEVSEFVGHPANERSLAVTRRLGMVEEAELLHPSRDHAGKVLRSTCST
jgi:hypothetical protein